MKRTIILTLCVICILSITAYTTVRADGSPNILLITIDTIRSDHLSCYGYERETTPNIDRFAEESLLFTNAVSVIPLTTPSHASIMTGLHPGTHQVYRNSYPVSRQFAMMAEIMRKAGYTTGGFVSTRIIESRIGFGQGFDFFSDVNPPEVADARQDNSKRAKRPKREMERRGDITTDIALYWLEENIDKKFFAWLHLYDPHLPYTPPDEYGFMYNTEYHAYLEKIRNPRFQREAFADQIDPAVSTEGLPAVRRSKPGLITFFERLMQVDKEFLTPRKYTPELVEEMISAYDGEIQFADEQVGRVLDLLAEKEIYDDTIIIVMGDHGEILFEKKKYFGHHRHLYQGSLMIPLIMKFPGIDKKRVDKPITNVDILPTLLSALDIENRMEMDGISYWSLIKKNSNIRVPEYQIFATYSGFPRQPRQEKKKANAVISKVMRTIRVFYFKIKRRVVGKRIWRMETRFHKFAIIEGDWKLIRIKTSPRRKDIEYELYNIRNDPEEKLDLSDKEEEVFKKLSTILKKHIRQKRKPIIPEQLQERTEEEKREEIRTLKSLGYM
ncbi:MAG: sulfatase [Spirochaetota bacterium]|nr:MAG: sulfatase [Spirochaetota bacterium]